MDSIGELIYDIFNKPYSWDTKQKEDLESLFKINTDVSKQLKLLNWYN